MAKSSKTSGKKGTTAGKAPTVTKKPKATAGAETVAPLAAGTTSTSAAAAAVAAATTAKATRSSATKQPGSSQMAPAVITSEERHRLIAEAAYLLAEKRGFQGGSPEQDWYEAAAQIDETIMGTNRGSGT